MMLQKQNKRPVLKIEWTTTDKVLEILAFLLLIGMWTLVIVVFSSLPETIPTHYNLAGKADGFGNKSTIFFLPILSTVLYIGMTILNNYPHIFNYPTTVTNQSAKQQYTIATRLIRFLKLIVVLTFSVIVFNTSGLAENWMTGLGSWFLPVFLGFIYVPLIVAIVRLFRAKPDLQ